MYARCKRFGKHFVLFFPGPRAGGVRLRVFIDKNRRAGGGGGGLLASGDCGRDATDRQTDGRTAAASPTRLSGTRRFCCLHANYTYCTSVDHVNHRGVRTRRLRLLGGAFGSTPLRGVFNVHGRKFSYFFIRSL